MTKKELKNIINKGFTARREKQKLRNEKNSARTKAWKLREAMLEAFLTGAEEGRLNEEEITRKKHYTGSTGSAGLTEKK